MLKRRVRSLESVSICLSPFAAPLESLRCPRIKNRRTETGEVFYVPRHNRKVVHQRGGGDQAVGDPERPSFQPTLSRQDTPPLSDLLVHRKYAASKPWPQSIIEPLLEVRPALAQRENRNTL